MPPGTVNGVDGYIGDRMCQCPDPIGQSPLDLSTALGYQTSLTPNKYFGSYDGESTICRPFLRVLALLPSPYTSPGVCRGCVRIRLHELPSLQLSNPVCR